MREADRMAPPNMPDDAVGGQILNPIDRRGRKLAKGDGLTEMAALGGAYLNEHALPPSDRLAAGIVSAAEPPVLDEIDFRLREEIVPGRRPKALAQDPREERAPDDLAHRRRWGEQECPQFRL